MVQRILQMTGASGQSRVLSLGCGIGDTELRLAPHVGSVLGVDLSGAAIDQARADAAGRVSNVEFLEGTPNEVQGRFDVVIAIFFLHHLSESALDALPNRVGQLLNSGGVFYSLDPSAKRLSGAAGRVLVAAADAKVSEPG